MLTTSAEFSDLQNNQIRKPSYAFSVSFDKQFDPALTFFTLDQSVLDGVDILAPAGDNVLTEWQKYIYESYTNRVISLEWVSEFSFFFSVTSTMADIELDNHDNLFTKGAGGLIDQYLVPRRPLRILAGFSGIDLPQFVGLSEKSPKADRKSRTASIHATDFLKYLFDTKLDEEVMLIDKRVDEIFRTLFNNAGVLDTQMRLDVARTTVPYAFFNKGQTLGSAAEELMKAEMGSLYMDEEGFIIFRNRLRQNTDVVDYLDESNVIDYDTSDESQIINSVTVKAEIREEQPMQLVYSSITPLLIPASGTAEFFFQFEDPVTTIDTIDGYIANTSQLGDGTDVTSDVTVTDTDLFSDSVKVVFSNAYAEDVYIILLNILGTPARIVKTVDIVEKDTTSIAAYEEQTYNVESRYIQSVDNAQSIALTLIRHFKDYGSSLNLLVKGNPARQISDVVSVDLDGISGTYVISKKESILSRSAGLIQRLTVQKFDIPTYFVLNQSVLDGTDVLAV